MTPNPTERLMAQVAAQVRARLAERPPDPARYPLGIAVGMFLDTPPRGSVASTCDNCQAPIVVGPDTQAAMARYPALKAVCHICALAFQVLTGGTAGIHRAQTVLRRPGLN
jgi:hypothetical protein